MSNFGEKIHFVVNYCICNSKKMCIVFLCTLCYSWCLNFKVLLKLLDSKKNKKKIETRWAWGNFVGGGTSPPPTKFLLGYFMKKGRSKKGFQGRLKNEGLG